MIYHERVKRCPAYLKLSLAGEDADPLVVVVGDDDVAAGVNGHTRGPLQLTGGPAPHPEATPEQALVGENLSGEKNKKQNRQSLPFSQFYIIKMTGYLVWKIM